MTGILTMQKTTARAEQVKKPLSGVTVILDFGHGSNDRRGKFSGNYSQSDVVDEYGRRAIDELETDNVRLFHVETRKSPGCPEDSRTRLGPATFVPIIFSCSFSERPALHNMSLVEFSGPYLELATRLSEGLTEWGRCYVWGHKVRRPVQVDADHGFIRVSPFMLNGPHEQEYLARLDKLGQGVGRAIAQYLIDKSEGRRAITSTLKPGLS